MYIWSLQGDFRLIMTSRYSSEVFCITVSRATIAQSPYTLCCRLRVSKYFWFWSFTYCLLYIYVRRVCNLLHPFISIYRDLWSDVPKDSCIQKFSVVMSLVQKQSMQLQLIWFYSICFLVWSAGLFEHITSSWYSFIFLVIQEFGFSYISFLRSWLRSEQSISGRVGYL